MRRISVLAVLFLVLLRIAIGWQFLYEGLWKYDTLDTANPWTAKGYLANAEGPFRDHFRGMVGDFPGASDPDDLLWLDYDAVSGAWDRWRDRFTTHYQLTDEQKGQLERLIEGTSRVDSQAAPAPLPGLPEGVPANFSGIGAKVTLENGRLVLSGEQPLIPRDVDRMIGWIGGVMTERVEEGQIKPTLAARDPHGQPLLDEQGNAVRIDDNLKKLFAQHVLALQKASQSSLGYRQRLRAALKGDPERVGVYIVDNQGKMGAPAADAREVHLVRYGEVQKFKDELAAYNDARARAKMPHEFDHLARLKTKLEGLKRSAVGPVKTLDAELKEKARALLTAAQVALGPAPEEVTPLSTASRRAMWALLVIGALLLLGLCTRLAALAGAVLLLSFYLVVPPWPGVPEPAGVTEHALIVNKNLIEVIALLALAALPTGSWFGIDGIFRWMFGRKRAAGT